MDDETLIPIGRFARATGLTVKALRHYDDVGVLRPAHVDVATGYRYYDASQIRDGEAIRRLRSLEVPLPEIAEVLAGDRDRLVAHGFRLHERFDDDVRALVEVSAIVQSGEELVPEQPLEFELVDAPELRLAGVMRHVHQDDVGTTAVRLPNVTHGWLAEQGIEPVGPPIGTFRFGDADGWHHLEVGWPVAEDAVLDDRLGLHVYPPSRAASLEHEGYDDAHETNQRFIAAVLARGFEPSQTIRMVYLSDHRYRVVWPVR